MSSNDLMLLGSGGGGGGSFRNRPDNLRSTDTFEALLGLTSSRARLAPGGLQNLFVDGVPIEDGNGNASFTDFAATLFDGDPTVLQPVQLKLGASSGAHQVGLALDNKDERFPGEWRNGVVTEANVNFIDIRLLVSQLYKQDKKGIYDLFATIEVELRPSGSSTWINPLLDVSAPAYNQNGMSYGSAALLYALQNGWSLDGFYWYEPIPGQIRLNGKTTSPYIKELRIAVPNTGAWANRTWEVRCRLMERDSYVDGVNEEHRVIQWESVAGVSTKPIGNDEAWRGLSYLQIFGKATDQITGVPEMTGIYDLGRHRVPPDEVWNPDSRDFTGAPWDGATTQLAWTACPAWQIKGLIEDDLSGISALVPGSTMNRWDTLEASKWFSERVPDGRGGWHPRYSAHWFQEQPMKADELVNYLAGAVGGFCWDEGDGRWRMKVERPETPVMVFTKENITGEFVYSHTDFDSRFNDYVGVFRNRENRYVEDRVRVYDQHSIDTTGRRNTTIALVGCDNRQEALRRCMIRMLTSTKETRMVTFTTNRQGGLLEQFSVIGVADGDLNSNSQVRSTGRVVKVSGDRLQITVRDALRLEVGVAYKVHFTVPNPSYNPDIASQPGDLEWRKPTITRTYNVTNNPSTRGDVYTLYLDAPVPDDFPEFAPVALEAVGLPALPKQYRVMNIEVDDESELVTITASEIYTSKWVESDNVREEDILGQVPDRTVPSPTVPVGGMFFVRNFTSNYQQKRVLTVAWGRPATLFLDGYRVEYTFNGGPWLQLGRTNETFYEMQEAQPGTYRFRIYSVDRRGMESAPLDGTFDLNETLNTPPVASLTNPTALVREDGDLSNAGGQFVLNYALGKVTEDVKFSVISEVGVDVSINALTGSYAVNFLYADSGRATFRAEWQGYTVDLDYTITRVRDGAQGPAGASLVVSSSSQHLYFDFRGNLNPIDQVISFTANMQNCVGPLTWLCASFDRSGQKLGDVALRTSADGEQQARDEVTVYLQGKLLPPGSSSVVITARVGEPNNLSYSASVARIQDAAPLASLKLMADRSVIGIDARHQPYPDDQAIVFSTELQNINSPLRWSIGHGFDADHYLTGTGDGRRLTPANLRELLVKSWLDYNDPSLTISVQADGLSDTVRISTLEHYTLDTIPPAIPTGLKLASSSVINDVTGAPVTVIDAWWDANTDEDLAYYGLAIQEEGGGWIETTTALTGWRWTVPAAASFRVAVRAFDRSGNASAYTPEAVIEAARDEVPPHPPTGFSVESGFSQLYLRWVAPWDADVSNMRVYEGATSNFDKASVIATVNAAPGMAGGFTRSGIPTGETRYYWVAAVDTSGNVSDVVGPQGGSPSYVSNIDLTPGLNPIQTVAALPLSTGSGKVVFLSSDRKLYRDTGTGPSAGWDRSTDGTDILAGTVRAAQIAAGAITVSRLAVQGDSLNPDPLFTDPAFYFNYGEGTDGQKPITEMDGWYQETAAESSVRAALGVNSCLTLYEGNPKWAGRGSGKRTIAQGSTYAVPLTVGKTYELSASMFNDIGQNIYIQFVIADVDGEGLALATLTQLADTGYAVNSITFTAPAGAVKGVIQVYNHGTENGAGPIKQNGSAGVSNVQVREQLGSTMIADNGITTPKIAAGAVVADHIRAGTITGDKFSSNTSLPASLVIGETGFSLGTIQKNAADPAAVINANTTQILPGKIIIAGATTLADWKNGPDSTEIRGGVIAANSIKANSLMIGNRGLDIISINFEVSADRQWFSWNGGGFVLWTDDAGNQQSTQIAANGVNMGGWVYIYWEKGAGGFGATTDWVAVRTNPNLVILATWQGAGSGNFLVNYGGTRINGDQIITGSVHANVLQAQTITGYHVSARSITADKLDVGSLSAITANIGLLRTADWGARVEIESNQIRVYDWNNVLRVRMGVW